MVTRQNKIAVSDGAGTVWTPFQFVFKDFLITLNLALVPVLQVLGKSSLLPVTTEG